MSVESEDHSTQLFVNNIHCDSTISCVQTIEETLSSLTPTPSSVDVSLPLQSVAVHHPPGLSQDAIECAVYDAGFDVVQDSFDDTESIDSSQHSFISGASTILAGRRWLHIEQCALCKGEQRRNSYLTKDGHDSLPPLLVYEKAPGPRHDSYLSVRDRPSSLIPLPLVIEKPPSVHLQVHSPEKFYVSLFPTPTSKHSSFKQGPFRVTIAVGGMTCSSCTTAINNMVSELSGVSEVIVNLLDRSAIVIVEREDLAEIVAETIIDCGFEAQIVTVELVNAAPMDHQAQSLRTLSLRIDGMFSPNCPEKVMKALDAFSSRIMILKPLTDHNDPIMQLTYQPDLPSLSIRTITAAIASAKSPPFNVSIHHPTSLEELSRKQQILEQSRLLRRLIVAVVVAIPTFIISIVFMSLVKSSNQVKQYLMEPMWKGNVQRLDWALFFLATPVMFYCANMFHRKSIKELKGLWRRGSPTPIWRRFVRFGSMNLLVTSGVSVAYFSSIALLGLAAVQAKAPSGAGFNTTYFDSVVFLTMFLLAGRCLEGYSKKHTADSITALGSLYPAEALLLVPRSLPDTARPDSLYDPEKGVMSLEDDSVSIKSGVKVEKIDVSFLEVGDVVRVQLGASPPSDGTIVSNGESAFDESSLTGESKLVRKQEGDKVFVGTINKSSMVDVRVDAIGGETMLDHIIKVVREGQTHRAPIERLADFLTGYFVPVVTLLAITTWLVWLGLGLSGSLPENYLDIPIGGWPAWSLEFAIAVFVVACPCGIGLAAPTALLVGSGLAAKFGILARGGGEAFQEMAQLDLLVFDKTGTLTEGGQPQVSDWELLSSKEEWTNDTVLGVTAALESTSSHPLATAIRHFCEVQGYMSLMASTPEETAGRGLKADFDKLRCTAIIGNEAWIEEHGVTIAGNISNRLDGWKSDGKSVVLLAMKDDTEPEASFHLVAIFAVMDLLRPEAKGVVSSLQDRGIATWMISGDNVKTAEAVARAVGIPKTNVIAGVLPHEKAQKIEWLQKIGTKRAVGKWRSLFGKQRLNDRCIVGMVGDGINDAPALTAADVGIAIGSGSDVAISSASFVLISSHLQGILTLSDLSRKVFNRVKFNFAWALCYNLAALPIAAGVLYPVGHIRLNPVWASMSMALSSVSVICSSLLLRLYKEPKIRL